MMTADTASDQLPAQPADRRPALTRYAQAAAWVVAVSGVTALVVADLFPQWLEERSQPYLTLAAATFVAQTLQFHIGVACVACVLIAAALRRRGLSVVAGMGMLLGLGPSLAKVAAPAPPAAAGGTLRLMSANVHLYNRDAAALVDAVRQAAPDVLVLQEYSAALDEAARDALGVDYAYQIRRPVAENGDGWAVYSRRPLLAPIDTAMQLDGSKRQARFAVRLGDKEVIVYALHLTSPQSIEKIGRNRAETADLLARVAAETRPVILAGDFNFTESTANAAALRGLGLRSTHDLAGEGRGSTWRYRRLNLTHRFPGFRIDHMFIGPQLTCTNARVLDLSGTDHRPIIADIALAATSGPGVDGEVASAE